MLYLGSGIYPHDACCCGFITCGLGLLHLVDPRGDGRIMAAELFHFISKSSCHFIRDFAQLAQHMTTMGVNAIKAHGLLAVIVQAIQVKHLVRMQTAPDWYITCETLRLVRKHGSGSDAGDGIGYHECAAKQGHLLTLLRCQAIVLGNMFPAHGLVTLVFRAMGQSDIRLVTPFIHAIKTVYHAGESLYFERVLSSPERTPQ